MADKDDKVKIEKGGDLKNSGSDIGSLLGSSSETVDLELADVNSADAKKKDDKTLEINLKTAATDADDGSARLAAALVTDSEEDDSSPSMQSPQNQAAAAQKQKMEQLEEERRANDPEYQEHKREKEKAEQREKENPSIDPGQRKKQTDQPAQEQSEATPQPEQAQSSDQPQAEAPQAALPDQSKQQPQQPESQAPEQPTTHPDQQNSSQQKPVPQEAQTAKNPPTVGQQPQSQPTPVSPTPTPNHDQKNPPKLNTEPTAANPHNNLQPPTVSKEALRDIGPHGNLENPMSQASQHTDPNKKIPTNQQNQVGNDLNSQKSMQPDGDHAKTNNQTANKPLQTTNTSGLSTNTEDKNALSDFIKKFEEEQQKEEEAYQKMNALQKSNRTKQQKKLLKELNKKNDKLIGLIERMILTRYFPTVIYKILRYQEEIGKLIKQLSKKKTIHRNDGPMNKLGSEIFFFEALVIYPILKTGAIKDAVKRFRNYWLSWSIELWWWTVIMAVFDLLIIFPFVFLLFGSVFDGPGIRLLKKIRKRNRELTEILTKIKKLAKPKGGDNENYIWHQKSYED